MAWRVFAALALMVLVAGCGAAPARRTMQRRRRRRRGHGRRQADISTVGDVTLDGLGPEGPRRPEEADRAAQQGVRGEVSERQDRARREVLRGPAKTVKLAVSGPEGAGRRRGQPGPPDHGRAGQGRADPPGHRLRQGLRLGRALLAAAAGPQQFSSDGKEFGSGDLYGLSQMGEIVGVFYNKDEGPDAADDARRVRGLAAGGQGRGRDADPCSATSRSGRASTTSRACSARPPTSRRSATSSSPRTGLVRQPAVRRRRPKIKEWVDKGYFNKNFNGTDYDPAWQAFAKGKSRYLIAGTWVTADLAEQMGDDVGFMLMPGKDPDGAGVARRRVAAVHDHVRGQEP